MLDEHLLQREPDGRELRALASRRLQRVEAPGPGRGEAVAVVEDGGGGGGREGAAVVAAAAVDVDFHYEGLRGHSWITLAIGATGVYLCLIGLVLKGWLEKGGRVC